MKYKVGDKVRVRKDLEVNKRYGKLDVVRDMTEHMGKIVTIAEVDKDGEYKIEEDGECYYYNDEMLEPIFKIGDKVRINKNTTIEDFTKNFIKEYRRYR